MSSNKLERMLHLVGDLFEQILHFCMFLSCFKIWSQLMQSVVMWGTQ